jgi:4-aminobutyrate aminotransferase-like enzyme
VRTTLPVNRTLQLLRRYESPNVTFIEPDGSWPIVWDRARGVHVWDTEGRRFLDLTAAFGVAAAGHANPAVVRAGQRQLARLPHAMGDVHPHALKAALARELSGLTFERWARAEPQRKRRPRGSGRWQGKAIFCSSGFEAVEAALKTALLATGKPGIIAFEGAYHGLGYGALSATHRDHFRAPFRRQLAEFGRFVPYPLTDRELGSVRAALRRQLERGMIGAILAEPVQGRGGIRIPADGFLPLLRRLCDEFDAVLVLDEIFTGFGRTGRWFACEHSNTVPDVVCLGKALAGGFPMSACIGRSDLMDAAWPKSTGEAIHTSTFLGNPVGCAMALAQIGEVRERGLVARSLRLGRHVVEGLARLEAPPGVALVARGRGLMAGLELRLEGGTPATALALEVVKSMLHEGFILLPEGAASNVIAFTPPLTISRAQLDRALAALGRALARGAASGPPRGSMRSPSTL